MFNRGRSPGKAIVDLSAATTKPAQPPQQQPTAKRSSLPDEQALKFGGGGLALLLLAGGAWAVSHRSRRANLWRGDYQCAEMETAEPPVAAQSAGQRQPSSMASDERSAFAWGNSASATAHPDAGRGEREPGETWVERAYRGPSPENPSLSLRKRLKRAAFFDQRDREVAVGSAASIDADAGLPEGMTERAEENRFETA